MQGRGGVASTAGVSLFLACLVLQASSGLRLVRVYHGDEVWTVDAIGRSFGKLLTFILGQDSHPPLYYLAAKSWTCLAGGSVESVRFLSFVFALFSIASFVFFHFRYRLIPFFAPLLLLATNPLFTYYAATVRPYAMVIFLASWVTLCFIHLRWFHPASGCLAPWEPGGWERLVLVASFYLACLLLGLTHYYGTLYVFILLIWDLYERRLRVSRAVGIVVMAMLLIWPILQFTFGTLDYQLKSNTWVNVVPWISTLNNLLMAIFPVQIISKEPAYVFSLCLLLAFFLLRFAPLDRRFLINVRTFLLASLGLEALLAGVILVIYLFSSIIDLKVPFSTPYYFLVCLPAAAILFGFFSRSLRLRIGLVPAGVFVGGVVICQLLLSSQRLILP